MSYQLLDQFEAIFTNGPYNHRVSTNGDSVAIQLYEDLYALGRSQHYIQRVNTGLSVLNIQNKRHGVSARRGDGSFGELVPNAQVFVEPGFVVKRGPIATIEIGIEVKILAKSMIKQIDRVISDLSGQVMHFKSKGGTPICVGVVGVNHAPGYLSFEGDRQFPTDGKRYKHPIQEAQEAERRLLARAAPHFDEFLILRFRATNLKTPDYAFSWLDKTQTEMDYGAILSRIGQRFDRLYK